MRRNARPLATFHLFLYALSLAGGTAQTGAGHPVLIGVKDHPESALLAEITAEMVRTALDVPFPVPDLADSTTAWKALRDGDIDVYPESIANLTAAVLHDPALRSIDRLRAVLAKHQVAHDRPARLRRHRPPLSSGPAGPRPPAVPSCCSNCKDSSRRKTCSR